MTYNTFAQDATFYGLAVARRWADYCGVSREQQLAWLEQLRGAAALAYRELALANK